MSQKRKAKDRGVRKQRPAASRQLSSTLERHLDDAGELMRRGRWTEAAEMLAPLDRRHPGRPQVLCLLASCYAQIRSDALARHACERWTKADPRDGDAWLNLATSYRWGAFAALAMRAYEQFLKWCPRDPRVAEITQAAVELRPLLDKHFREMGLAGDDSLELCALHEEAQCWLERGQYGRVLEVADKLLARRPDFVAALNNSAEACFREANWEQAIARERRVLDLEPENVHALANLVRFLMTAGREVEARAIADRLKHVESPRFDLPVKQAQALSMLGDDRGVIDAHSRAEPHGAILAHEDALLCHLAAVAHFRLGNDREARALWRQAIELRPSMELARENLVDLAENSKRRHAPWPFDISEWIPRPVIEEFGAEMQSAARRAGNPGYGRRVREFLERHPQMAPLIPALLDRGDPAGRQLALNLAMTAATPRLIAALRDFALGQRGPDELRQKAAQFLNERGELSDGRARMWIQGEWRELLLRFIELHGEVMVHHAPRVVELAKAGHQALVDGRGVAAEELLKQALALEPDSPDLLNNLGQALSLQDRDLEAYELLTSIHQRFPDYLFARTALAMKATRAGDFQRARQLLDPLLRRRRMHFSEFAAHAAAEIELLSAERKLDAARSWYQMWKQLDPEHPQLERWSQRFGEKRHNLFGNKS